VTRDISVYGGDGGYVVASMATTNGCSGCNLARNPVSNGAGARGGHGLVQLMVPAGLTPRSAPRSSSDRTTRPWWKMPAARDHAGERGRDEVAGCRASDPALRHESDLVVPRTDPITGKVVTDADGNVLNPDQNNIKVDMLPVLDPITGAVIKPGKGNFVRLWRR
jgi:hypothetical protein